MFYADFMTWDEFRCKYDPLPAMGRSGNSVFSVTFPKPDGALSISVSFEYDSIPWGRQVMILSTDNKIYHIPGVGSYTEYNYEYVIKPFLKSVRGKCAIVQCGFNERLFV